MKCISYDPFKNQSAPKSSSVKASEMLYRRQKQIELYNLTHTPQQYQPRAIHQLVRADNSELLSWAESSTEAMNMIPDTARS